MSQIQPLSVTTSRLMVYSQLLKLCMGVLLARLSACALQACTVHRGQQMALDLELELKMVASWHLDAENQTCFL